jgi:predicted metal-dependent enzyme (double-stranded beta helix superfamily)
VAERDLPDKPSAVDAARELGGVGSRVVYEDDRVRVWFLKLAPGEQSAIHRHDHDHLLVQIRGDRVTVIPEADSEGPYNEVYEGDVDPGMVTFVSSGGVETAVNTGEAQYHEVIVELKQPVQAASPDEAS